MGESNTPYELSKLFKPITDTQKELKESIISEIKPIRERIKNLPKVITFPQFPSITMKDDDDDEEELNTHSRYCQTKLATTCYHIRR